MSQGKEYQGSQGFQELLRASSGSSTASLPSSMSHLFIFPASQGSQYWRFDDGVLDPDYPRNISEGFDGIPDNIDAALALPAHRYSGRERAYFFKGTQGGRGRGR